MSPQSGSKVSIPCAATHRLPAALTRHLRQWLGGWPPASVLQVVGAPQRTAPGWDGRLHPALGVPAPTTGAFPSVPPAEAEGVRRRAPSGLHPLLAKLPELVGEPDRSTYRAVFRWTTEPADLPA
jgi:hypothetical protein